MTMHDVVAERFATRSQFFGLIIDRLGGHETEYAGYVHDDGSRIELQPPCIVKGLWRLWRSGSFTDRGAGAIELRRDEAIIVCDADLPAIAAWLVQRFHGVRAPLPFKTAKIRGELASPAARDLA